MASALGFRTATLCMKTLGEKFKVGDNVTLSGWVSFARKQKDRTFVGLRDAFGTVQIVVPNTLGFESRLEDVVTVKGVLSNRVGRDGEYEILASEVIVENHTKHPLPLNASSDPQAQQTPQQRDLSLKYRYLDLRLRSHLQRNLRIRGVAALAMRNYMTNDAGFLEVETPTLFKSTPEGAREFLVPVQTPADQLPKFYALVQSPQQYKQMLMVGGIDRYFQFARCYRDEGGRADRQPEFTQLDLEMSFVRESHEVERVIEGVVCAGWKASHMAFPDVVPASPANSQFPRMSLAEAMRDYGSDKPNLTFGMKIESGTSLRAPHLWGALSRREKDELRKTLLVSHQLVDEIRNDGDDYVISVKPNSNSNKRLGKARLILAEWMRKKSVPLPPGAMKEHSPFWVTDFGMFEPDDDGGVACVHHPFTAPHPDDLPKLNEILKKIRDAGSQQEKNELQVQLYSGLRAMHYDLVCDGVELGGGSIRIHSADLQLRVFQDALGISEVDCQAKFGHLLEALSLGAPPHGGFALGFDRFISMLCGATSLSDTLAFPKSSTGTDPLTGAPCPLTHKEQDDVLGRLALRPSKAD